jgi:hypothetical protein
MKVIELFNRNLNKSTIESIDSTTFKEQINLLLNSTLVRLSGKEKAIVIGAGKMNDFSLSFFVKNFEETVLTDVDLLSVNESVRYERLSKKENDRLTRIRIEYTGFEINHFFSDFKERIVNCHSYDKLEKVIKSKLDGLENYKFLKHYEGKVDFIYVSPIYTQLVYNQLLRECAVLRENRYPEHFIKYLEEILLDEMVGVIDRFNNNLVDTLKENGIMFVLSDIFQVDIGSEFHVRVKNGIKNFDVMEEIYSGYQAKFGTGLGDYGLINLDEKVNSLLSRWLIWPYDDKKVFVVKLKIFKK